MREAIIEAVIATAIAIGPPGATALLKEIGRPHIPADMRWKLARALSSKVGSVAGKVGNNVSKDKSIKYFCFEEIQLASTLALDNAHGDQRSQIQDL